MHAKDQLEQVCSDIYRETREFAPIASKPDLGFEILMTPPIANPQLAFVGYQPGFGAKHESPEIWRSQSYENSWPLSNEYLIKNWRLATTLRKMFAPELLERSIGLNAVFLRSRNINQYKKIDASTRKQIEKFSLERADRILQAARPKTVVIIGFQTLDLFSELQPVSNDYVVRDSKRRIAQIGTLHGIRAVGVPHLTGSRGLSDDSRRRIAALILAT